MTPGQISTVSLSVSRVSEHGMQSSRFAYSTTSIRSESDDLSTRLSKARPSERAKIHTRRRGGFPMRGSFFGVRCVSPSNRRTWKTVSDSVRFPAYDLIMVAGGKRYRRFCSSSLLNWTKTLSPSSFGFVRSNSIAIFWRQRSPTLFLRRLSL